MVESSSHHFHIVHTQSVNELSQLGVIWVLCNILIKNKSRNQTTGAIFSLSVVVSCGCFKASSKLGGLKQHKWTLFQFHRSEVQIQFH